MLSNNKVEEASPILEHNIRENISINLVQNPLKISKALFKNGAQTPGAS